MQSTCETLISSRGKKLKIFAKIRALEIEERRVVKSRGLLSHRGVNARDSIRASIRRL